MSIGFAATVLASVDWNKVFRSVATDAAGKGAKGLLSRLKPGARENSARHVVEFFVKQFVGELEDKTPLSAAVQGYQDQLKRLTESAGPEIAAYLQPDTRDVNLAPIERMWHGLRLDPLPENFDWSLVGKNFEREIRAYVRGNLELREQLSIALQEQQTELQAKSEQTLARIAGPDPGFDLIGYREYLRRKCGVLQLGAMHTSTYDRRINLWSVFVAPSARQSIPVRDVPRELLRRLREEKHLTHQHDEAEITRLRELYQNSSPVPVLDVLARERLVVVLGDPGSGKTSLLKFLVMRWIETGQDAPLPMWIDLREYVRDRHGILRYLESGYAKYRMDSGKLEQKLKDGQAAIYLDGLDEIFDDPYADP